MADAALAAHTEAPPSAGDRSYQALAEQIVALIKTGEFSAGMRLPSERMLAERFGVSRTSVREAIIALEVQGLVEVRVGSGIYVCAGGAPQPFAIPAGAGPIETLRARALIESEVAALAATNRKDSDLDRLFDALTAMREHMDDKRAYDAADRRFHLHIAEATGNDVLLQIVQAMWDNARQDPRWDRIEQHFHTPALRCAVHEDHQRIFAALMARDAGGARAAMHAHLERIIAEFTQTWR